MATVDLAELRGIPAFLAGVRYPFRGARFVYLQHPGLVRYWIFPILITLGALVAVSTVVFLQHDAWVEAIWASPAGDGFWDSVLRGLHAVVEVLVAVVLLVV